MTCYLGHWLCFTMGYMLILCVVCVSAVVRKSRFFPPPPLAEAANTAPGVSRSTASQWSLRVVCVLESGELCSLKIWPGHNLAILAFGAAYDF